jgi:dihydroorotate dehydrogenase
MLFINPPFGNYFSLPKTKSIRGSFTLHPRPGLIGQIIKTLHYSSKYDGWVNKIGLRNPGLQWAINKYSRNDIISIAILDSSEIPEILKILPKTQNIELNASCPNIDKGIFTNNLSKFQNNSREWCIVKLSPTADSDLIDSYYKQGFRQFHCSNTLKVAEGGLSGLALIPYTLKHIYHLRKYNDVTIIAGGGVYNWHTYVKYKLAGADHISISTVFFHPFKFLKLYSRYLNRGSYLESF